MVIRDPLLGEVLNGRYRVDFVVARGGMAMVYRGTDLLLESQVGIKVMHGHLSADEHFVERFEREAENAARLTHPNLVAVHDQQRDGDIVYLVMEYVESVTLRKELKHRGHLTPRQAIVVTDAVLAALEVVHGSGMIHRDLKPDNILLGVDGQIKLADFGLARAVTSATTTKTLIGTVGYVAPELVTRTGADRRTDLYTLGIMLYEMLTGSLPYTDDVPIQVAYRHVHDTVPAPSLALPGLDPALDALVLWATARQPDDRPDDASILRRALGETRATLSDAALDLGAPPQTAPQPDSPVITATAGLSTAAAPVEVSGTRPRRDKRSRTDEIPFLAKDTGDGRGAAVSDATAAGTAVPTDAATLDDTATLADTAAAADTAATTDSATSGGARTTAGADQGSRRFAGTPMPHTSSHTASTRPESTRATAAGRPARRRRRWLLGTLAALLVVALGGWGIIGLTAADPTEPTAAAAQVEVPQLTAGMKAEDATDALTNAGFTPVAQQEFSSTVPAGMIVGTTPKSGTAVDPHSSVTVRVSKGSAKHTVPDVRGLSKDAAAKRLNAASLALGTVTKKHSDSVKSGQIISQSLKPGSQADGGTKVTVVISTGEATSPIPNVQGYTYGVAFKKLVGAGFRVAREDVYSDTVAKGAVVSQYPGGSAGRKSGALVFLKVSKGKKPADTAKKKDSDSKDSKAKKD